MSAKVEIFSELDAVARVADGALDRAVQPLLFDRLDWYRLMALHCPPKGVLAAAHARDGASNAWLFLARRGQRAEAYANWYSLRFGAPVQGRGGALQALAQHLRRDLARVELYPLAEGDPLPAAFQAAGWLTELEPAGTSWCVRTEGRTFDEYWTARPGRLRNTAKRKAKAAGLEIAVHRRFDPAVWAEYETVYAGSWKGEEGSPAFLRALAEQEGAAGTLRLGIARKDGQPIATQLWLVENGQATIHKLAYVEDAKALSPGTILSVEMFRSAIDEDRVAVIDFGTGNDTYKAEWMEESAPLYRLTACNPTKLLGLAHAARAWASKLVRRLRSD